MGPEQSPAVPETAGTAPRPPLVEGSRTDACDIEPDALPTPALQVASAPLCPDGVVAAELTAAPPAHSIPAATLSAAPSAPPVVPPPTADSGAPTDESAATAVTAPPEQAAPMPPPDQPPPATEALEELTFPPSVAAPPVLAAGAALGPNGRLRVMQHLDSRGRINCYAAVWHEDNGQPRAVELREGPADHAGLQREDEVLGDVCYAMLPRRYASFEENGRRYLALEPTEGETLDAAIARGLDLSAIVSVGLQLAQALRRLHAAGWALVGLSPAHVVLGQPLRITRLGAATRIGQAPDGAYHVAGYSAPELADTPGALVTGREDVYSLGAILYRALAGQPVPEAGAELSQLPALVPIPGGPQLLVGALAPADERLDLAAFYRQLLTLKQRYERAAATVALEIASGTTVGLNPTRLVNEDACGYVTWAVAGAQGVVHQALLCVADGMGGMEAGEVASEAALRTVLSAGTLPPRASVAADSPTTDAPPPHPDPVALIRQAAPVVHAMAAGRQSGTTCTVVAVHGDELTLGHVGDTRAYLLRDGALTRLTNDHSLVAAMVASGVLSPDEARGHPDSNKVLRSLGGQRELPEGYVDSLAAAYGQPTLRLQSGDWLLLCTDGVWGTVDDATLREVLLAAPDPQAVARALVDRALVAGAPDNATALVARCVQVPSA